MITIRVSFSCGDTIDRAAEEAIRLAEKLDACVEFDFNGTLCYAYRNDTPRSIVRTFLAQRAANQSRPRGHECSDNESGHEGEPRCLDCDNKGGAMAKFVRFDDGIYINPDRVAFIIPRRDPKTHEPIADKCLVFFGGGEEDDVALDVSVYTAVEMLGGA